jgi:hypothetical protein
MLVRTHTPDTLVKMSIVKGGSIIYVYNIQGSLVNTLILLEKRQYFLILIIKQL